MAITTVAKLNTYLGETDTPASKTAAVAAAISFVQSYCGRTFDSTRWRKWQYVDAWDRLILEDRPIISLRRCAVGTQNVMSASFVSTTADAASLSSTEADVLCRSFDTDTETNTTSTFGAAPDYYPSVATVAARIEALAGWTATKLIDEDSFAIKPSPPLDALNTTVYLEGPDDEIEGPGLDVDAGIIRLGSHYTGWVYADYTVGYSTIPPGLEQVTTEIAASILKSSAVSGAVQSERIGDYQYTAASGGMFSLGILSSYESRLDLYRKVRL